MLGREGGSGDMADLEYGGDVAEPFRFNFEIAWEVANKGIYMIVCMYIMYVRVLVVLTQWMGLCVLP